MRTKQGLKMVKVTLKDGKEVYLDGILKRNLDLLKRVIKKDWDHVLLVDGEERSGKSVLAQQVMSYLINETIPLENICMNHEEFLTRIKKCQKNEAIIYDEGFEGLSNRSAMSRINRVLVKAIAEIGQKNLFVAVVMPSFFDLDKYYALHRSRCLLHVYADKEFNRGYFSFYGTERKKQLFVKGKQFYNYNTQKPAFRGRFTKPYMVDEKAYRAKKLKALEDTTTTEQTATGLKLAQKYKRQRDFYLFMLQRERDIKPNELLIELREDAQRLGLINEIELPEGPTGYYESITAIRNLREVNPTNSEKK